MGNTNAPTDEPLRSGSSTLLINTVWYLIPLAFTRGLTLILTPFYTRALSPRDFAIISTANAVAAIVTIVLGLGLYGVATRIVVEHNGDEQRRQLGTLFLATASFGAISTVVLLAVGSRGLLSVFSTLQFDPHLQLILAIGVLNTYSPLPTAVFAAQDRPKLSSGLGVVSSVMLLVLTIYFVRFRHEGAVGVLRAQAIGAAISALVSIVATLSFCSFDRSLPGLRSSLAMGVPLVPHLAANWALSISDRLVLERFVTPTEMSQYSLSYLFSLAISLCSFSINAAFSPLAQRKLLDSTQSDSVPKLGSVAFATTVSVGFGAICFAPEVIAVLAPPSYAPAFRFVPMVVTGAIFQGVYQILAVGTWFSKKTKWVAIVTLIAATTNILLNVALVPRFGATAAAFSTVTAYALSALLHGILANRVHPIAWEYKRWVTLSAIAAIPLLLVPYLSPLPTATRLVVKLLLCVGYGVGGWQWLTNNERAAIITFFAHSRSPKSS